MRNFLPFLILIFTIQTTFTQQHNHDDTEIVACRNQKMQLAQNYIFQSENKRAFEANYHISLEKFFELNPIYTGTMIFQLGEQLCANELQESAILARATQFIKQNEENLLFAEAIGVNGEKLLGKFIYEGNPNSSVFPLAAGDPCTNPDFTQNNYTGWQTLCGTTNGTAYTVIGATQYVPGVNTACGGTQQHTIYTGGSDPVVPSMPCVNPNGAPGSASVRIGDGTGTGARASVLRQTFLVSAASSAFSYSYAAVLQDPGHSPSQQPFFKATIYDQNNVPIPCGQYQAFAGDGQSGWVNMSSYVYKNWSTSFVDLTAYIGQNVTVEFSVGDCSPTAHYAYAYVQAACTSLDVNMSSPAICGGQAVTITAPSSAQYYQWNTGHTTPAITVTTPGTYTVNLTPNNAGGANCGLTLSVVVPVGQNPTADFTYSNTIFCEKDSLNFINLSTAPGTDTIRSVAWNFGDGISAPSGWGNINGVNQTGGSYFNPSHWYTTYGNRTITMTVTGQNGCTATRTRTIQVLFSPTVIAGSDVTLCQGNTATLNASGAVSYSWSGGAPHNTPFEPPVGQNVYYVTGIGPTGCPGRDSVLVNVTPGPVISAGNDTSICIGDTIRLSAQTQVPSFTWNNGVQNNVPFIPSTSRSYIVSATQAGCTGRDTVNITVNTLPSISAGADIVLCENDTATLTGTGGVSYTWSNGVLNNAAFIPSVGSTNYGIVGTDANGCSNTDTVNVQVIALPIILASNDTAVCAGNVVTLSASGTAPSFSWTNGVQNNTAFTPANSQWYFVSYTTPEGCSANDSVFVTVNSFPLVQAGNDSTLCEGNAFTLQANGNATNYIWSNNIADNSPINVSAGTYTYVLTGTSAAGCATLDTIVITVNASPIVNAGIDQSICAGDSVVLTATGAGAPFIWSSNVQNGTAFSPNQTREYTVQTQAVNGCVGFDTVRVVVNALPTFQLADSLIFCENTPILLSVNANGTITWSDNVQNGVAFQQNVGEQHYTVTVTDANNCAYSDVIKVIVVAAPQAGITANPITGFAPLPVDFTNISTGNYTQAIWNLGDNTSSSSMDSILEHSYNQPGTYIVVLTVSNAYCQDSDSITIIVTDKPIDSLKYQIPNVFTPNGDGANDEYHFALQNAEYVKAYVYNRWGSFVALYDDVTGHWDGKHQTGEEASEGVYFVVYEIKGLDGTFVQGSVYVHLFREP